MLEQLERAINEFEMIHGKGKKMALFGFDRSSNHAAYPEDALRA